MNKKNFFRSALLLSLIFCRASFAAPKTPAVEVGAETGATYRVLCLNADAPYLFRDGTGELRGVYADILNMLGEAAHVRFVLSVQPPSGEEVSSMFDIQPDILLGSYYPVSARQELYRPLPVRNFDPMSPRMEEKILEFCETLSEREKHLACLSMPFLWKSSTIFQNSRRDYALDDLAGKRVCVLSNSHEERLMKNLAVAGELLHCATVDEGLNLLQTGGCDAFVAETFQSRWRISRTPRYRYGIHGGRMPVQSYERSLVVLRGNTHLAAEIGRAIYETKLNGRYDRILKKWLSGYGEYFLSPSLTFKVLCCAAVIIALILFWNRALKRKISVVVSERGRLLDFVRDGILAVDERGNITMMNRMAKLLLGLHDSDVGKNADALVPTLDVQTVIDRCRPVYNLEQNLRGALVSCNKVPVNVASGIAGAIVTLRDLSELYSMAEEMTGVKLYVESLRIRNHEFMNTLQAISGLIQLKEYDKALRYIAVETDSNESVQSFMTERIKNAAVCGVLMGKAGVCREQHINFVLAPDSFCADHDGEISDRSLVLIVGNLLQNAIEALMEKGTSDEARIDFSIYDESGYIFLSVRDSAGGLTPGAAEHIFEKGFSTKKRPSGFGLYSIHNIVESLGGDITVDYETGKYTDFTVSIPVSKKQEVKTHV